MEKWRSVKLVVGRPVRGSCLDILRNDGGRHRACWFVCLLSHPGFSADNHAVQYGALAGLTEDIRKSLTHEQGLSYQKGSIVMFAAFYDLMLLNWSLKFSLLAFYARLT